MIDQNHNKTTDFGSVSDMLTDEEREESLRGRVAELTEAEINENCVIVDLDEFRFLLRLLDEVRAERDAMQRDFDAEGKGAYQAGLEDRLRLEGAQGGPN